MVILEKLYNEAKLNNIQIDNFKLNGIKGMSYSGNRNCSIAIDYSIIKTEREEKQVMAEELCHCKNGYMYKLKDIINPLYKQNISKCESLTARETAKKLVPLADLQKALKNNLDIFEISEELDVDMNIVKNVIDVYKLEKKI